MKIAVATTDGVSLSPHFGRSAGFIIFEVEGAEIRDRQLRTNQHTPHAQGLCQGEEHAAGHHHSHAGILSLLNDCQVVLCGGMGMGASQALTQQGIEAIVLPSPSSAEEAVSLYLSGKAPALQTCSCTHS